MSSPSDAKTPILTPVVNRYIDSLLGEPDPLALRLSEHAQLRGFPLIGHTSGNWLELLTRSIGGKRVFEFGSGFGFSAYYFARAVGENGEVIGSEHDAHELVDFRNLYDNHPFKKRIDIRIGCAFETFHKTEGMFDVILIDIEKEDYTKALDAAISRTRTGGLILADNVLWGGKTAHPAAKDDPCTAALQDFNRQLFADKRIQTGLLPAGDGLSVSLVL